MEHLVVPTSGCLDLDRRRWQYVHDAHLTDEALPQISWHWCLTAAAWPGLNLKEALQVEEHTVTALQVVVQAYIVEAGMTNIDLPAALAHPG